MNRRGRAVVAALLLGLPATGGAAAGDGAGSGVRLFQRCYACHSVQPGEVEGLQGPNLRGIVGRPIAAQPGFGYSPAMRRFAREQGVWTRDLLARFLAGPEALVPGTSMSAGPIRDPAERAVLLDYLAAGG